MKVINLQDIEETKAYFNPKIRKRIVLASGELGNIYSFAEAVIPPGEISTAHSHEDMAEVFFVLSGRGVITIDSKKFQMTPGLCAAVDKGEVHEIENTGDEKLRIIYFEVTVDPDTE